MKAQTTYSIFLVDDHPIVLQGMVQIINAEEDLQVVGTAQTAHDALAAVRREPPDLIIVDVALKRSSGLDLVKEIRGWLPDIPILLLSMHDETLYAERALRAGARGYIMKQEATEKVVEAIRRVLSGNIYLSDRMVSRILNRFVGGKLDLGGSALEQLSDRELEVFRLVGLGFSTREIAEKLCLSVKTIETHRANLKEKLGLESGPELIRFAMKWVQSENLS